MTTKKSISVLARLVLGAVLVGLPTATAIAGPPTTADSAEAMAQQYREQAAHYWSLGGVGYKTGLVQRAEADAAKYAAVAERLRSAAVAMPARSSEAEHYAQLAEQYRKMGGVGYKSGMVQRAEAQARAHVPAATGTAATARTSTPPTCSSSSKPSVRMFACAR